VNWDLSSIEQNEPLVNRGGAGAWDKDQIMAAPSIVTHNNKHWIYYLGKHTSFGEQPFASSSVAHGWYYYLVDCFLVNDSLCC
jgi:hypothetical protein